MLSTRLGSDRIEAPSGRSSIKWDPPDGHPLRRMFAGLAEHAFFSHLGVADPPLTDYLSRLLTRFLHFDAVYRLRNGSGQPISMVLPLSDFAKAYDGPPTDPQVYEEQQRKLQDELQRRAEESRTRLEGQRR